MGINVGNEPQPAAERKPWTLSPYTKTQGGVLRLEECRYLPFGSQSVGFNLSNGQTYAKVDAGAGSAATANVSIGHEFKIGEVFGLELSANGKMAKDLVGTNVIIDTHNQATAMMEQLDEQGNLQYEPIDIGMSSHTETKYHTTNMRATGDVMFNSHIKGSDKNEFTVGIGGSLGVNYSSVPHVNIDNSIIVDQQENQPTGITMKESIRIGEKIVSPVATLNGKASYKIGRVEAGISGGFDCTKGELDHLLGTVTVDLGKKTANKQAPQE